MDGEWLGINRFGKQNNFVWASDKIPISSNNSFIGFNSGYPIKNGGNCGAVYRINGLHYFQNDKCKVKKAFVCEAI